MYINSFIITTMNLSDNYRELAAVLRAHYSRIVISQGARPVLDKLLHNFLIFLMSQFLAIEKISACCK